MTVPVVITVEARSLEHKVAKLMMALSPLEGLIPWMKEVVEPYIQDRALRRFRREGDDVAGAWANLADSTKAIRTQGEIDYGEGPINFRTGELERFITESSGVYSGADGVARMVYPPDATGTLESKMIAAQQGFARTRLPNGGIGGPTPARPVIGINELDAGVILSELELFILAV